MDHDNEPNSEQSSETSKFIAEILSYILIATPFVASLAIVGLQTYIWLRSGSWPKVSILDGMKQLSNNQWLIHPTDWTGLHSIFSNGSLSAALFLIGVAMAWMVANSD